MKTLLLTFFILLGGSPAQAKEDSSFAETKNKKCSGLPPQKNSVFFPAKSPKALVLVAHGLNNKPQIMGDDKTPGTIIYQLISEHYSVLRVALYGHGEDLKEMEETNKESWQKSAYLQYCELFVKKESLPLYLLAYSLGALTYQELMNEETATPVRFDKAILFAPAITTNSLSRSITWLNLIKSKKTIIPSIAPKNYRAHSGTSLGAYEALFDLEDDLEKSEFKNNNIPTLVFIHPNDEVVSFEKLKRRIEKFHLKKWKIHEVSTKDTTIDPKYHHLIIDQKALGEKEWPRVNEEMMDFLKN